MTNSLGEIEKADVILALGNLIEQNNPVVASALRRASRTHGRRLIIASSKQVDLDTFADPAMRVNEGRERDFLNVILRALVELNLVNQEFVTSRTRGFEDLQKALAQLNADQIAGLVGLPVNTLKDVARTLGEAPSLAIVYSEDLTAGGNGTSTVEAIGNLALLSGRLGQERSGIYPLYRHINAQGALDMGATPHYYPGHVGISALKENTQFWKFWGAELPDSRGLSYRQILEGCHQQQVNGLYILGEDPIGAEPEKQQIQDALRQVEFLVVQDVSLTQSSSLATVVLPATSFLEQEGTLTNIERRTQKLREILPPPGSALPDWRILADLLARLDPYCTYPDVQSIYHEIMEVVPYYRGLAYDRLEEAGLQWPCSEKTTKEDCGGMLPSELFNDPLEFIVPL